MKRSKFSLSHYKLLTMDMGYLIPIAWYEAIPGDTIQQATSLLVRVSPLLSPVMHPVRVRVHHWFVPLRLIWDDFEDFITGGSDGNDTTTPPYFTLNGAQAESTLADYLGIPSGTYSSFQVSALPFRAYDLIYNENYRDQDLDVELVIDTGNGSDTTTEGSLVRVNWEKDYFTTCRPWETKGSSVTIPLGGEAAVKGIGKGNQTFPSSGTTVYETGEAGSSTFGSSAVFDPAGGNTQWYGEEDPNNSGFPGIYADLSVASGVDINELRSALAIQRFQEARARYGSDYVEYLRYLGITRGNIDARLQKPEYLGGGRQTIQFSEVLSTNDDDSTDYAGRLRGHGIAAMRTNQYRRFIEEHGIVMSLMSVIPKTIYANGLHKQFSRTIKEHYFQKELTNIGEQQVLFKETYSEHSNPEGTFGYQARYDEYRSHPSGIAGEFRSTLDHWHYGRIFTGDTALNASFVNSVPTKRVNVSSGTHCLYVMANHSIQARRMLPNIARPRTF